MLYRHVQPLFLSSEYTERLAVGPRMRVRPLDTDAPDHAMRFVLWGAIQTRDLPAPPATPPTDSKDPVKKADEVVVTAPVSKPKLLIEMSPDGEGWVVVSTLDPRERPYLVTIAQMLPFVRVRLETSGTPVRGYALVLANTPFELEGRSPIIAGRTETGEVVVTGTRR